MRSATSSFSISPIFSRAPPEHRPEASAGPHHVYRRRRQEKTCLAEAEPLGILVARPKIKVTRLPQCFIKNFRS
jgi:hypothetical protein